MAQGWTWRGIFIFNKIAVSLTGRFHPFSAIIRIIAVHELKYVWPKRKKTIKENLTKQYPGSSQRKCHKNRISPVWLEKSMERISLCKPVQYPDPTSWSPKFQSHCHCFDLPGKEVFSVAIDASRYLSCIRIVETSMVFYVNLHFRNDTHLHADTLQHQPENCSVLSLPSL